MSFVHDSYMNRLYAEKTARLCNAVYIYKGGSFFKEYDLIEIVQIKIRVRAG